MSKFTLDRRNSIRQVDSVTDFHHFSISTVDRSALGERDAPFSATRGDGRIVFSLEDSRGFPPEEEKGEFR